MGNSRQPALSIKCLNTPAMTWCPPSFPSRRDPRVNSARKAVRLLHAILVCVTAFICAAPAAAAPSYMSYFGLAWNMPETQDHVNLYWDVSWDWDSDELL